MHTYTNKQHFGNMTSNNQTHITNGGDIISSKEDEQGYLRVMQLSGLSALPLTLKAAIELGLLDILVRSKANCSFLSALDIAKELSIANPEAPSMIDRMLCYLATYDIIESNDVSSNSTRRYKAGAVCSYLTQNDDGASMAPYFVMTQEKSLLEGLYHLKDAVLEGGIPFHRAYGKSMYEFQREDNRLDKVFCGGMANHSSITNKLLLAKYTGFKGLGSIVDVGGGVGAFLALITSKYPSAIGINFDQPHVVADAPALPGIKHVGGDMFDSVPSGDAIILKWILHNWSDEDCIKLLKICRKALPEHGKVTIVEGIFPETPDSSMENKILLEMDMSMLTIFGRGKERSLNEFESMATEAGFSGCELSCSVLTTHVIELTK